MNHPKHFPPPELPPEYSAIYEGASHSFEGQRLYRLYIGTTDIGIFYDNNKFWPKYESPENITTFPSREAMYNWIVAQCVLNLWSEK